MDSMMPIHPGETVADLLVARKASREELCAQTGVSDAYLTEIIEGKRRITESFAIGLERFFGIPDVFWNTLQKDYDEDLAALEKAGGRAHA